MTNPKHRVGIVGYGQIGSYVYDQIGKHPEYGVEIVFVHDAITERLATLPTGVVLHDIHAFAERKPDLVCELAHRDVSKQYGVMFLQDADYFALSITAFADAELDQALREAALANGRRLLVPHGGIMGLDAIIETRDDLDEVHFTMTKNPANIDFKVSGIDPATIKARTVVYDGPTRGVCGKFPRNVNTHAAVALAGLGFDRTHSTLIADPSLDVALLEVAAKGGGIDLYMRRTDSIKGVSGVATLRSVLRSIVNTGQGGPGLQFC
jgi:aspartate dehydrogenase